MGRYVLSRLASMAITLFMISLIAFALILLVPGDPARAILGESATNEQLAQLREQLGFNDPFYVRYLEWVGGVIQGDLGTSLISRTSVGSEIVGRLAVTLPITAGALLLATVVGVPAGVLAALRRGQLADRLVALVSTLGVALPHFWIGLMLAFVFAVQAGLLPATGYVPFSEDPVAWFEHMILPVVTLSLLPMAEVARQMRASLVRVLDEDYIRTTRAMGLPFRSVVGRHAIRNALTPVLTILGAQAALVFGGTVTVDVVFALPGLGQLAINAVVNRDYPVIQGIVVVSAVVVMLVNLVVDISYRWLNPRIR